MDLITLLLAKRGGGGSGSGGGSDDKNNVFFINATVSHSSSFSDDDQPTATINESSKEIESAINTGHDFVLHLTDVYPDPDETKYSLITNFNLVPIYDQSTSTYKKALMFSGGLYEAYGSEIKFDIITINSGFLVVSRYTLSTTATSGSPEMIYGVLS